MQLTITKKFVLSGLAIVALSVGTMVGTTIKILEHGFIEYLNVAQARQLVVIGYLLGERYRQHGNFNMVLNDEHIVRQLTGQKPAEAQAREANITASDFSKVVNSVDPMGFLARVSLADASGRILFGSAHADDGKAFVHKIVVEGKTVGTLSLVPINEIAGPVNKSFMQRLSSRLTWLAAALILLSALLASWFASHLLKPIDALRSIAKQIARGKLNARITELRNDELGELARHVNEMAKELEENDQMRRRMLADVSHELRTPLAVVRVELEALIDGIRPTTPAALESLHMEVLRLSKLMNDLQQLAMADAGYLRFDFQSIDIGDLLLSLLNQYDGRFKAAGLDCAVSLMPGDLKVYADPDRLTQVIANLFENSIRYTDTGGQINVNLAAVDSFVELMIEDSAPGVLPGMHERLFDRLYRADPVRTSRHGGSGLGLSICRAFVKAHQGEIFALPSQLGGIKIVVRLPSTN